MVTGEYTVSEYLNRLASKEPVPGGGGAAALSAAMGAALASMVCSLTLGKKKYAAYEADIDELLSRAGRIKEEFLSFADSDAAAFLPLAAAYSMPRNSEEEKAERSRVMQNALAVAAEVPLKLIACCAEAVGIYEELEIKGSMLALSDVAVGARLIEAAADSALMNVYINTKLLDDRKLAGEYNLKAEGYAEETGVRVHAVFERIKDRLKVDG